MRSAAPRTTTPTIVRSVRRVDILGPVVHRGLDRGLHRRAHAAGRLSWSIRRKPPRSASPPPVDPLVMTSLWWDVDVQTGWIRIRNDGPTLPLVIHKGVNLYVPEMVLGIVARRAITTMPRSERQVDKMDSGQKSRTVFRRRFT